MRQLGRLYHLTEAPVESGLTARILSGWDEAERLFPESSAAWDRDMGGETPKFIVRIGDELWTGGDACMYDVDGRTWQPAIGISLRRNNNWVVMESSGGPTAYFRIVGGA